MGCYAGGISWAVNLNRFLQPFWLENCKVRELLLINDLYNTEILFSDCVMWQNSM